MNYELTSDDDALLTALAVLGRGSAEPDFGAAASRPDTPGPQAEAVDTLTRLYHEVLGLIPSSLPPMAPDPQVKTRLMAAVSADVATFSSADGQRADAPPLAFPQSSRAPRARRSPWLAVAAMLILTLLATCGWLYRGLVERDQAMTQLAAQRTQALRRLSEAEVGLRRAEVEAKNVHDSFSVVTSPAVEVCALRPSSSMPEVAAAHGILFVAADHQHWYMSLRGLRPAGPGKVYQMWFVGAAGPVTAGTFSGDPATAWELGSEHMPSGTKDVRITVEEGNGSPSPRGPEVLRNTDLLRVL